MQIYGNELCPNLTLTLTLIKLPSQQGSILANADQSSWWLVRGLFIFSAHVKNNPYNIVGGKPFERQNLTLTVYNQNPANHNPNPNAETSVAQRSVHTDGVDRRRRRSTAVSRPRRRRPIRSPYNVDCGRRCQWECYYRIRLESINLNAYRVMFYQTCCAVDLYFTRPGKNVTDNRQTDNRQQTDNRRTADSI